jgi:hypothetical protein
VHGQGVCPDGVPKVRLGFEAAFGIKGQTILEPHAVLAEAIVEWIVAHRLEQVIKRRAISNDKTRDAREKRNSETRRDDDATKTRKKQRNEK